MILWCFPLFLASCTLRRNIVWMDILIWTDQNKERCWTLYLSNSCTLPCSCTYVQCLWMDDLIKLSFEKHWAPNSSFPPLRKRNDEILFTPTHLLPTISNFGFFNMPTGSYQNVHSFLKSQFVRPKLFETLAKDMLISVLILKLDQFAVWHFSQEWCGLDKICQLRILIPLAA